MAGPAIIIDDRGFSNGEYKKYRSTQEQIQQNQRENQAQRQRDERARNESGASQNTNNTDRRHSKV